LRRRRIVLIFILVYSSLEAHQFDERGDASIIQTRADLKCADTNKSGIMGAELNQELSDGLTLGYFKGAYSVQASSNVSTVTLSMHIPVIHRETAPIFFNSWRQFLRVRRLGIIHVILEAIIGWPKSHLKT
jgi:hypothetical protein